MNLNAQHSPSVSSFRPAMASPALLKAGDQVKARNRMFPFWMTVMSVNERTGFCQCNFGYSGRYAGNFQICELEFFGGEEIQGQLAS